MIRKESVYVGSNRGEEQLCLFPSGFDGHKLIVTSFWETESRNIYARKYFYPLTNSFDCYNGRFDVEKTPVANTLDKCLLPLYADLALDDAIGFVILFLAKDLEMGYWLGRRGWRYIVLAKGMNPPTSYDTYCVEATLTYYDQPLVELWNSANSIYTWIRKYRSAVA